VTARVIILLGPPGGGKGTQAVRLSAELKIPHVSTGDLFRENRAQGTALGKRAQTFMDAGQLVPDDLVLDMLFDRVSRPDCKGGYLLDGHSCVMAVHLKVPDAILVDRVVGRRTCSKCGTIFHLKNNAPKVAGKCDKCGGDLVQRADDAAETVKKRLVEYAKMTAPLKAYYGDQKLLRTLDGMGTADEVFANVEKTLGK
jgi:adenylate kinase